MTNENASGIIHRTNMTPAELGYCCAARALIALGTPVNHLSPPQRAALEESKS